MAQQSKPGGRRISLQVSTTQRPDFKHPLIAYVFDGGGQLLQRAEVRGGKLDIEVPGEGVQLPRLVLAPAVDGSDDGPPSIDRLLRLGAYEPVLRKAGKPIDRIDIPGALIDIWPFCFCWVRGRVVRASDNRPVCNARVHICEVDRIPWWILRLPDPDIFRLRDDLLEVVRKPPIPIPEPDPEPFRFDMRRLTSAATRAGFDPQPEPPAQGLAQRSAIRFDQAISRVALNPQPLPPKEALVLPFELHNSLLSHSATTLRRALAANWQLIVPWLCLWPHWWWWFRCDEIAVVDTDGYGNFERLIVYPCHGDHPDLYFWVEFDLGSGFETVYRPAIGCHTHWNYVCGSEVTIPITDPRVPGCGSEPDLPGKQVVVLSIGPNVAVREVGAGGLTNFGEPFGHSLEPRVDFSRTALIGSGIPYYRWSYRRLTGPDGTTPAPGGWTPMTRDVYRHYKDGTTYPSVQMGPLPTSGSGAAPAANLFRIRPFASPSGDEWIVLDEHVDLATAYFDTQFLPGNPTPSGAGWTDDLAAGLYELKLELFDTAGNPVDWTAQGVDLRITDQDAPFGTGTITTTAAPNGNRLLSGTHTTGFRMVVRVDNNRCFADVLPVGGTIVPDPLCGFHTYNALTDTVRLSFVARHPNDLATYWFGSGRGVSPTLAETTVSGKTGDAGGNGFAVSGADTYAKDLAVSVLVGACPSAALWERADVYALATNGYGRLGGYDATDNAAFALTKPCPGHSGG